MPGKGHRAQQQNHDVLQPLSLQDGESGPRDQTSSGRETQEQGSGEDILSLSPTDGDVYHTPSLAQGRASHGNLSTLQSSENSGPLQGEAPQAVELKARDNLHTAATNPRRSSVLPSLSIDTRKAAPGSSTVRILSEPPVRILKSPGICEMCLQSTGTAETFYWSMLVEGTKC